MAKARAAATSTPGVVLFAAVVLFVIGGLHAIQAISELVDNTWTLESDNGLFSDDLYIWGIIDAVLAVLLVFGGISLLAGQPFGRWVAIVWAIFAAIRWMYWIPAAPLFSIVALVITMMVLYAATVYPEHFEKAAK
jgi:hypothetical protein